jgi:hypothetical protein
MNLGDLVKTIAPVVAGAYLGPVGGAVASGLGAVATGGKPKDALRYALLSGLGGVGAQKFFPAADPATQAVTTAGSLMRQGADPTMANVAAKMANQTTRQAIAAPEAKTISGELLSSLGFAGTEDDPNLLFKVLNTDLGQGIGAGLLAQLLSGLGEEEDTRSEFEKRPFGSGGPGGQLGGINYMADGGDTYFPRRNGGISPSEGSGTKDDVPAMLMAGEFVMTRDAVEGAGDGDINKGINRMYNMMDNFERMS